MAAIVIKSITLQSFFFRQLNKEPNLFLIIQSVFIYINNIKIINILATQILFKYKYDTIFHSTFLWKLCLSQKLSIYN